MQRLWIQFLWRLMPKNYRRDIKIRLMRTATWWMYRDQKTYEEVSMMLKDIPQA